MISPEPNRSAAGVEPDTGAFVLLPDPATLPPSLATDDAIKAVADTADAAAVAEVRQGDTARFEELVMRHSPRLFAMVRKYVRREDDVEDLVQEVFLKAFRRLELWRAGHAQFTSRCRSNVGSEGSRPTYTGKPPGDSIART